MGLKIGKAKNVLLIVLDVCSKLGTAAYEGQTSRMSSPLQPHPPAALEGNFLCWPFERSCLRLLAQASKSRERVTLLGSQG